MNAQIKVYAEWHVSSWNLSLVATLIMRMQNVATYRIWEQHMISDLWYVSELVIMFRMHKQVMVTINTSTRYNSSCAVPAGN